MVAIGSLEYLEVERITSVGAFLDGEQLGSVLLPKKYLSPSLQIGDRLEVFVHRDSNDRLIATADVPRVQVGQIAYLRVTQVNQVGAFVDMGLTKELLIPFAEQHKPLEAERSYLVRCYLGEQDQRLVGTTKIDRWLSDTASGELEVGQEVSLMVGPYTELGQKVVVNHQYWGLIHKNQIFRSLRYGQSMPGYVSEIRADGKLDIVLAPLKGAQKSDADLILDYLKRHGGEAEISDRSPPAVISREFGISKAAFKRAIGHLYRKKMIELSKTHIRLADDT